MLRDIANGSLMSNAGGGKPVQIFHVFRERLFEFIRRYSAYPAENAFALDGFDRAMLIDADKSRRFCGLGLGHAIEVKNAGIARFQLSCHKFRVT